MKLGVNIDHIATIRQARRTPYPDIVEAARAAEAGGADFITVHLREDRRHIIDTDLPSLLSAVEKPLNLEIAPTEEMQQIALSLMPPKVCVVPEKRAELTTEGGLNVCGQAQWLRDFAAPLLAAGIEVSFFIDPAAAQIEATYDAGVRVVELHTGEYAHTLDTAPLADALADAAQRGMKVNAGHGLTLANVEPVCGMGFAELHIGHAIVGRALFVGLTAAVQEMREAMGI